jgi:hypothetical protein
VGIEYNPPEDHKYFILPKHHSEEPAPKEGPKSKAAPMCPVGVERDL